jgi:hypothetical protein
MNIDISNNEKSKIFLIKNFKQNMTIEVYSQKNNSFDHFKIQKSQIFLSSYPESGSKNMCKF